MRKSTKIGLAGIIGTGVLASLLFVFDKLYMDYKLSKTIEEIDNLSKNEKYDQEHKERRPRYFLEKQMEYDFDRRPKDFLEKQLESDLNSPDSSTNFKIPNLDEKYKDRSLTFVYSTTVTTEFARDNNY